MADLDGGDLVTRVHEGLLAKHKSKVFGGLAVHAVITDCCGEYERTPAEIAEYSRADIFSVNNKNSDEFSNCNRQKASSFNPCDYNERIWAISLGRGYNGWWHDKKYRIDILALEFKHMPTKKELADKIKLSNDAYQNSLLIGFNQVVLPTTSRFAETLKASLSQHFYVKWDGGFHNILLPELRGVDKYAEEFVPIFVDAIEAVLTNPPSPTFWRYSQAKTPEERDSIVKEEVARHKDT